MKPTTGRLRRRALLAAAGAGAIAASCGGNRGHEAAAPGGQGVPTGTTTPTTAVPLRPLGSTGVMVSMIGLGGHHIGRPKDEQEGIRLVRMAIDHGITFLDNCWDYNQGQSEERMGKALAD